MQRTLLPTLRLSLEMTDVLARMERNGLKINLDTLEEIRQEYQREMDELEVRLERLARDAMGDTPVNLSSPDDRSVLLYSRRVKDKKRWSRICNLGHEMRANTMKPKQRTRMKRGEFKSAVKNMTYVVYKTRGSQCDGCKGEGRVRPLRKDGTQGKAVRICRRCNGAGVLYIPTGKVAGFKIIPRDPMDTAAAGFRTDKVTLDNISSNLSPSDAIIIPSKGESIVNCLSNFFSIIFFSCFDILLSLEI